MDHAREIVPVPLADPDRGPAEPTRLGWLSLKKIASITMKCDSRTIGREHSEAFDEVTADLRECKMEEIIKHLNKLLPLITKRMTEHNLLE